MWSAMPAAPEADVALVAMTTADVVDYVSDRDPAKKARTVLVDPTDPSKGEIVTKEVGDGATVFGLKALDVFLMGYIYDTASVLERDQNSSKIGIHTRVNQTNIDAVRFGLATVRNFKKKDGSQVVVKTLKESINGREYEAVTPDVLTCLGIELIGELAGKIKEISSVSAEEEKNSEGASSQSA
jgi:hypothetical protein